ncbi:hypothetical protein K488DRAFT_74747, partial [Vararia minispora EC-137]
MNAAEGLPPSPSPSTAPGAPTFYQAYARLVLAVDALRPLPDYARALYLDPLTREVKAASIAYRAASAQDEQPLACPPLLIDATAVMQSAWNNRDPREAAVVVSRALPSLPESEPPMWLTDLGPDRWWESLASPSVPPTPTQPQPAPAPPLPMHIPESDYAPPRGAKRKERAEDDDEAEAEAGADDGAGDAPRKLKGKTLVITPEMLAAGLND